MVQKWLNWVFDLCELDLSPLECASLLLMVITPENFMMIWWQEHSERGVMDGQTDGRSQLKIMDRCRVANKPLLNQCSHSSMLHMCVTQPQLTHWGWVMHLCISCFSLKSIKKAYYTKKPWLTAALQESIKVKNKLYVNRHKVNNPDERCAQYKIYCNKLHYLLHADEWRHYQNLLYEHKSNVNKPNLRDLKAVTGL